MSKKLKIIYLSGPANAKQVLKSWAGESEYNMLGDSYLSQFYQICHELGAEAYVITTRSDGYVREQVGSVIIENRPLPEDLHGFSYHLAILIWFMRLIPSLWKFSADVAIVTALQNYSFLLNLAFGPRTKIISALHSVLWPRFGQPKPTWRTLLFLNRWLYYPRVRAFMAVSEVTAEQVRIVTDHRAVPISVFRPIYASNQFDKVSPVPDLREPFRIFFAGRVETNKGIYDLLSVAGALAKNYPGNFLFDICGDGSELARFREMVSTASQQDTVLCHGWCDRTRILEIMGHSHCVVVPTTSECEEGFNKVCAEAILVGRPVVTSAVCPALESIRPACIEVEPDDVQGYLSAIYSLRNDASLYQEKQRACRSLQEQFHRRENSYGEKLKIALKVALGDDPRLAVAADPNAHGNDAPYPESRSTAI